MRVGGGRRCGRVGALVVVAGAMVTVPALDDTLRAASAPLAAGAPANVATAAEDAPAGTARFVPVTPARLLDTRTGLGVESGAPGPLPDDGIVELAVAGQAGVAPDAVAVALTVTATEAGGPGYVTAWPAGHERPMASTLNVQRAGQTVPNAAVVALGEGGRVAFYAQTSTHLVADVTGYWVAADRAAGGRFQPVPPARLLDTRTGEGAPAGLVPDDGTVALAVAGRGGLPPPGEVAAVVLNVTATGATGPGYVTAWPGGERPQVSALNPEGPGRDVAGLVVVPVAADGTVSLYAQTATHLVADVTGWFTTDAAAEDRDGLFVPQAPQRVLDTRLTGPGPLPGGQATPLDLAAATGTAPDAMRAVVANVTATDTTAAGFVTVAPALDGVPATSTLNTGGPGETIANLTAVAPDPAGRLDLYAQHPLHLVVDVAGWFVTGTGVVPTGPVQPDSPGTTGPGTTVPGPGPSVPGPGTSAPPTSTAGPVTTPPTTPPPPAGQVQLGPWTERATAPVVRSEGGAAVVGNRLYLLGGYVGRNTFTPSRRVDIYDPATNSWSRGPDLPTAVSHVGVAVIGTDLYLAGGYPVKPTGDGQNFSTAEVWRLDTRTGTYHAMPALRVARGSGALVALDGRLHFFTGIGPSRADRTEHWVLDPAGGDWSALAPVPMGRSHIGYIVHQGRIWAIGGHQRWDEFAIYLDRVDVYDPATNSWAAGPALPAPRAHIGGAVVHVGGRIVVLGGDHEFKKPNRNVWVLDADGQGWSSLGQLPAARYAGFAGVIGDRLVYSSGDLPRTGQTWTAQITVP